MLAYRCSALYRIRSCGVFENSVNNYIEYGINKLSIRDASVIIYTKIYMLSKLIVKNY